MQVKVIGGETKIFNATSQKPLEGGQRSKVDRIIFTLKDEKSLWLRKGNRPLGEYLGYVALRFLKINVPDFYLGIISSNEELMESQLTFLQEYISARPCRCKKEILDMDVRKITPIIMTMSILNDDDGIGQGDDNLLLTESGELFRVDCGRAFLSIDFHSATAWVKGEEKLRGDFFNQLIIKHKDAHNFILEANLFLDGININDFKDAVREAYQKFKKVFEEDSSFRMARRMGKNPLAEYTAISRTDIKIEELVDFLEDNILKLKNFYINRLQAYEEAFDMIEGDKKIKYYPLLRTLTFSPPINTNDDNEEISASQQLKH